MSATATRWRAHIDAELAALDARLAALLTERQRLGLDRSDDPFAGVVLQPTHAAAALRARAAASALPDVRRGDLDRLAAGTPLGRVWERFDLSPLERFVTVVAAAPELDGRYATVFAFLQDDSGARCPTVGLVLELWAGAGLDGVADRAVLAADATLRHAGLVDLVEPAAATSLLDRQLAVDEWLVDRCLGREHLDVSLRPWVRTRPGAAPGTRSAPAGWRGVPVVWRGRDSEAVLDAATAGCGPTLVAAPPGLAARDPAVVIQRATRDARAAGRGLVVAASLVPDDAGVIERLESAARHVPIAVVGDAARTAHLPATWWRHDVAPPGADARARRWQQRLDERGLHADAGDIKAVAFSHPLPLGAIDAAVHGGLGGPNGAHATDLAQLRVAARGASGGELARLTHRVETDAGWDDLILAPDALDRLRDIARSVDVRHRVLDEWGFGRRPGGRGVHLLFAGPSGTGKTLAAAVLARAAGYELRACDVSQVVDKYIGETEKRLDEVLREAEAANCVLLFDEADALFGRRAEVRDARDRYANIEVAYLLQRIERHEGITILATNLGQHLDEAFARRLHHRVDFHPPDAALRRRLWRRLFPVGAPLAPDVDLDAIADHVELTGGAIRNATLAAAYLAAADGRAIGQHDVVRSVLRELDKLCRRPSRAEHAALTTATRVDAGVR